MDLKTAPTRKNVKRAEIVAIAKRLFFRAGFSQTSMAQISAEVGGSKATLYSHFKSKDELLIAVIEDILKPVNEGVKTAPSPEDFKAWLRWFGIMGLNRIMSDDIVAVRRIAAAEALRFPDFGRLFYERGVLPSFVPVAEVFGRAMERGILRRDDPQAAAMIFIELCSGWRLRLVDWNIAPKPDAAEIDAIVNRAVDLFLVGYGTAGPLAEAV